MDQIEISEKVKNFKIKRQIKILLFVFVFLVVLIGVVVLMFASHTAVKVEIVENNNTASGNKLSVTENKTSSDLLVKEAIVVEVDDDGDGLSNRKEKELGTNPDSLDSDGDGIIDGEEVDGWHTNPLQVDSDGDGLSDYNEAKVYGTDPNRVDTDNDGYSDGDEVSNGYNPKGAGALQY